MFSEVSVSHSVHRGCAQPPLPNADPPPIVKGYGQQVGGTHPTGTHSCSSLIYVFSYYLLPLLDLPGKFCWLLLFNFSILSTILPIFSAAVTVSIGMSVGSKDVHVTFQYRNYSTKLNKVET